VGTRLKWVCGMCERVDRLRLILDRVQRRIRLNKPIKLFFFLESCSCYGHVYIQKPTFSKRLGFFLSKVKLGCDTDLHLGYLLVVF